MRGAHIQMDDRGPSTKYSAHEFPRGDAGLSTDASRAPLYLRPPASFHHAAMRTDFRDILVPAVYALPASSVRIVRQCLTGKQPCGSTAGARVDSCRT